MLAGSKPDAREATTGREARSRRRLGQRPMIARRKILMAACICVALAAVGARAAESSAKSFVESIYAAYKGKDSKGISLETTAAVRRYFDPKLAALIIKDRKDAHGEVGKLGSDPFIDAQDWEIDTVDVAIRAITPTRLARRFHSKVWASSARLSSLWSSSRWAGASPTSRRTATKPCANF